MFSLRSGSSPLSTFTSMCVVMVVLLACFQGTYPQEVCDMDLPISSGVPFGPPSIGSLSDENFPVVSSSPFTVDGTTSTAVLLIDSDKVVGVYSPASPYSHVPVSPALNEQFNNVLFPDFPFSFHGDAVGNGWPDLVVAAARRSGGFYLLAMLFNGPPYLAESYYQEVNVTVSTSAVLGSVAPSNGHLFLLLDNDVCLVPGFLETSGSAPTGDLPGLESPEIIPILANMSGLWAVGPSSAFAVSLEGHLYHLNSTVPTFLFTLSPWSPGEYSSISLIAGSLSESYDASSPPSILITLGDFSSPVFFVAYDIASRSWTPPVVLSPSGSAVFAESFSSVMLLGRFGRLYPEGALSFSLLSGNGGEYSAQLFCQFELPPLSKSKSKGDRAPHHFGCAPLRISSSNSFGWLLGYADDSPGFAFLDVISFPLSNPVVGGNATYITHSSSSAIVLDQIGVSFGTAVDVVQLADFNKDGYSDVLSTFHSLLFLGTESAGFATVPIPSTVQNILSHGDPFLTGSLGLLGTDNEFRTLQFYPNVGPSLGFFAESPDILVAEAPFPIEMAGFAHLNHDDLPDIWFLMVQGTTEVFSLAVMFGESIEDRRFSDPVVLMSTLLVLSGEIEVVDLTGDGLDDFLFTGNASLWVENVGGKTFVVHSVVLPNGADYCSSNAVPSSLFLPSTSLDVSHEFGSGVLSFCSSDLGGESTPFTMSVFARARKFGGALSPFMNVSHLFSDLDSFIPLDVHVLDADANGRSDLLIQGLSFTQDLLISILLLDSGPGRPFAVVEFPELAVCGSFYNVALAGTNGLPSIYCGTSLFTFKVSPFTSYLRPSVITLASSNRRVPGGEINSTLALSSRLLETSVCRPTVVDLGGASLKYCGLVQPITVVGKVVTVTNGEIDCTGAGGMLFRVTDGAEVELSNMSILGATGITASLYGGSPIRVDGVTTHLTLSHVSAIGCSTKPSQNSSSLIQTARLMPGWGGVVAVGSTCMLTVQHSLFANCSATEGGGVFAVFGAQYAYADATVVASHSRFLSNTAPGGGAVYVSSGRSVTFTFCTFENNVGVAGGVIASLSQCDMEESSFRFSESLGGVDFLSLCDTEMTSQPPFVAHIAGPTFIGNSARYGGLAFLSGSRVALVGHVVASSNVASIDGGLLFVGDRNSSIVPSDGAESVFETGFRVVGNGGYGSVVAGRLAEVSWIGWNTSREADEFETTVGLPLGKWGQVEIRSVMGDVVVDPTVFVVLETRDSPVEWRLAGADPPIVAAITSVVSFAGVQVGINAAEVDDSTHALEYELGMVAVIQGGEFVSTEVARLRMSVCDTVFGKRVNNTNVGGGFVTCGCSDGFVVEETTKCRCERGMFPMASELAWSLCASCPQGATCGGEREEPESVEGWWRSSVAPPWFLKCEQTGEACLEGNTCAPGSLGRECSRCAHGWFFREHVCHKCYAPGTGSVLAVVGVVVGLAVLVSGWLLRDNGRADIRLLYDSLSGVQGGSSLSPMRGEWLDVAKATWKVVASLVLELCVLGLMAVFGFVEPWEVVVLVILALVVSIVFVVQEVRIRRSSAAGLRKWLDGDATLASENALKALVMFFQTVSVGLKLGGSSGYDMSLWFGPVVGVAEKFNFGLTGVECMGSVETPDKFYFLVAIVPFVIVLSGMVGIMAKSRPEVRDRGLRLCVATVYILFFPLVEASLANWPCSKDPTPGAGGTSYMVSYPWVVCGEWRQIGLAVSSAVCMLVLGCVLVWAYVRLYRDHDHHDHHDHHGVHGEGGGGVRVVLEFLIEPYEKKWWWWEGVVLGRRVLVAAVGTLTSSTAVAFHLVLSILLGSLGLHVLASPFEGDGRPEAIGLIGSAVVIYTVSYDLLSGSDGAATFLSIVFLVTTGVVSGWLLWHALAPIIRTV